MLRSRRMAAPALSTAVDIIWIDTGYCVRAPCHMLHFWICITRVRAGDVHDAVRVLEVTRALQPSAAEPVVLMRYVQFMLDQ